MKQESHNPSMVQVNAMSEVCPLHLVVDKELHDHIVTFLSEQMIELMKESEKENNKKKDGALVLPPISMVGAVDVGATINKRKRVQIQDNKPYGETIGTLQLPNNCILNDIDLDNDSDFGSKLESWSHEPSDNKRIKVENVETENLVEPVLTENFAEDNIKDHIGEEVISGQLVGDAIVNENVIKASENVAETAVANQLGEAVINNQLVEPGPKLTSNASIPPLYPNEEIYELMSTEDMLKEFELHCQGGL
ncbi:unnamed protein product [Lupinus luteus]|uniref:Uncharacterized protein n=1 Tax=Lupinus luteus TaxID=3873 RepID=A0AAV1W6D3_LUPLU